VIGCKTEAAGCVDVIGCKTEAAGCMDGCQANARPLEPPAGDGDLDRDRDDRSRFLGESRAGSGVLARLIAALGSGSGSTLATDGMGGMGGSASGQQGNATQLQAT
jgi:hypothetical protein